MRDHDHYGQRPRSTADQTQGLALFDAPSVAVATSEAAAESIKSTVRAAHTVILALLLVHDFLTCEEIRDRTGWSGDYARPRLWELEGHGWIAKCDGKGEHARVQHRTRTGRLAACYELTTLGRRQVEGGTR